MESRRTLFLVPTELELRRLILLGGDSLSEVNFKLCGFGPILSAINTTAMLSAGDYDQALLCGIAGAYPDCGISLGTAVSVSSVMLDAVGVYEARQLKTGQHLGFSPALPDQFELSLDRDEKIDFRSQRMLTVCTASHNLQQASERKVSYSASIEDMEGYGVAAACYQRNVPLSVIRGVSNTAGDRDKSRWCIDAALGAVAESLQGRLG